MITLMALVMATQAALVYQVQFKTSVAYSAGIAGAVMLFIFEGAFTIGFQATVWVYPSEILPLRLRQRGSSISTASNWICNFIIVQITPPAISNVGWRTYIIFAVLNVNSPFFSIKVYLTIHLICIFRESGTVGDTLLTSSRPRGSLSSTSSSQRARAESLRILTASLQAKMTRPSLIE